LKFLDDTELVNLSTPHVRRLFVILDRGRVLWPIVAVTAVICGLVAVQRWELTDSAAAWGLQSLRILQTETVDVDVPDDFGGGLPVYRPPLAPWLNATSMWLLSPDAHLGLVLPCCVAYVGLVLGTFLLFGQWCGPRYAFLAAMMIACHGPLLVEATDPAPVSLSLCLAVFSLWSLTAHLRTPAGVFSWWLVLAGVCWGLCLLAGGLFAALPMLTALMGIGWQLLSPRGTQTSGSNTGKLLAACPIVVIIAALVVAGSQTLPFSAAARPSVGLGLLSLEATSATGVDLSRAGSLLVANLPASTLGLSGLTVLGAVFVLRDGFVPVASANRGGVRWIVCWLGVSLVCWLSLLAVAGESTPLTEMCRLYCTIGLIGCAVVCFEEAALCRVHPLILGGCVVISSGVLYWTQRGLPPQSLPSTRYGLLAMAGTLVLGVLLLGTATHAQQRPRRRVVLGCLLLVQLAGNASVGLDMTAHPHHSLQSLSRQLRQIPRATEAIFVSDDPPPDRLSFTLRTFVETRRITRCANWVEAEAELERLVQERRQTTPVLVAGWGVTDGFPLGSERWGFRIVRQTDPEHIAGRLLVVTVGSPLTTASTTASTTAAESDVGSLPEARPEALAGSAAERPAAVD